VNHHLETNLDPPLRQLPLLALELGEDGLIRAANPAFESAVGCQMAGTNIGEYLDDSSRVEFDRLVVASQRSTTAAECELSLRRGSRLDRRAFCLTRDERVPITLWLVERPMDSRVRELEDRFAAAEAELSRAQSNLAKKNARLASALLEIDRKLAENEQLHDQIRFDGHTAEAQSEELLAMTERLHRGEGDLLRLKQQLERRSRELHIAMGGSSRFYATMSHELRTPVNAVMGYNDLLLAGVYGELTEQQELAVERSQKAVRHLRELINDVLDLSQIETGKFQLDVELVPLEGLLKEVVAVIRPLAAARGAVVHLEVGEAPATIHTDGRRLRQILFNLLSHGVSTGEGRPVWIRVENSALGGIELEVVDNGSGIPGEELTNLFDEFTPVTGQKGSGTGLGLAIALRLARLLGGELTAESTVGVGTTFRLKLPKSPPEL